MFRTCIKSGSKFVAVDNHSELAQAFPVNSARLEAAPAVLDCGGYISRVALGVLCE